MAMTKIYTDPGHVTHCCTFSLYARGPVCCEIRHHESAGAGSWLAGQENYDHAVRKHLSAAIREHLATPDISETRELSEKAQVVRVPPEAPGGMWMHFRRTGGERELVLGASEPHISRPICRTQVDPRARRTLCNCGEVMWVPTVGLEQVEPEMPRDGRR